MNFNRNIILCFLAFYDCICSVQCKEIFLWLRIPFFTILFYLTFFTTSCFRGCALFISDCINVFRSRYKAARIALQMYCSRILRYEYTRSIRMLQFSRAWCLACISSRNFIPRLSHVYVSTTHHLREYTQQVTAPTELTATVYSARFRFVSVIYFAFSKGEQDDWKSKSKWKKLAPTELEKSKGFTSCPS